jgi:hypothetical protein
MSYPFPLLSVFLHSYLVTATQRSRVPLMLEAAELLLPHSQKRELVISSIAFLYETAS